jgi:hypothetical protein
LLTEPAKTHRESCTNSAECDKNLICKKEGKEIVCDCEYGMYFTRLGDSWEKGKCRKCPYGLLYSKGTNFCYMYNVKLAFKTFNDAKAVCVAKGSHLFEIKNARTLK